MSHTFKKLVYHIVLGTKHRRPLLDRTEMEPLAGFIAGILARRRGRLLASGGMPDHIHLLASWGTDISVANMVQVIKSNSSRWLSDGRDPTRGRFAWQTGYAAFSVSESQITKVKRYLLRQESHHAERSSEDELVNLLRLHNIDAYGGELTAGVAAREPATGGTP